MRVILICIYLVLQFNAGAQYLYRNGFLFVGESSLSSVSTIENEGYLPFSKSKTINIPYSSYSLRFDDGGVTVHLCGTINRTSSTPVVLQLSASEIPTEPARVSVIVNQTSVMYTISGKAFGYYSGKEEFENAYIIKTRFLLTAPKHPSFYLEIPVLIRNEMHTATLSAELIIDERVQLIPLPQKGT